MDERFRLSLPPEFASAVCDDEGAAILAKERSGCLSLWPRKEWEQKLKTGVSLLEQKMSSGRMEGRYADVQRLGRLLSTRHQQVTLAKRSRLVIPETFRDFLGTAAGQEVVIVGAAVCVEIWHVDRWLDVLKAEMPEFGELFKTLTE